MTVWTKLGNDVFSPVDSAGDPRKVENHDAQVWATEVERMFSAWLASGGAIFATKAQADGSLAYPANTMAWVLGDATASNNGIYQKIGASGSGSWQRRGDLPYSYIKATNAGAGTANAIAATTPVPVPGADGGALIALNITDANTGAAVVSFNGAAALTIVGVGGEPVSAGDLVVGMIVAGYKSGTEFRLITDTSSAANKAAAEAAQAKAEAAEAGAEAARDIAAGYASDAVSQGNVPIYATVAGMSELSVPAGISALRVNGYAAAGDGGRALYKRVDSEPTHAGKFQSADGAWWEIAEEVITPLMLGAIGDGVALDGANVVAAAEIGRDLQLPDRSVFNMDGYTVTPVPGQRIIGPGKMVKTATTGNGSFLEPFIRIEDVSDVVVDGIEFFMPADARRLAVSMKSASRITIQNCRSMGNETFCFIFRFCSFINVVNNFISGGMVGVATGGDISPTTGGGGVPGIDDIDGLVTNVRIAGNFITGCSSEAIDINWDTQRCLIQGNICIANNITAGEEEIDIGGGTCRDIIISNNIIRGSAGTSSIGITLKLATTNIIIASNSIQSLDVANANGVGIRIYYQCVNITVANNHINSACRGISAYGGSQFVRIIDNVVENVQRTGIAIGGDGLSMVDADVRGNKVRNTGLDTSESAQTRSAIAVHDCAYPRVADNYVNLAGNASSGAGLGIAVYSTSAEAIVSGNRVESAGGRGISVEAVRSIIGGNHSSKNGTEGIYVGAVGCVVSDNTMRDNGQRVATSYGLMISDAAHYTRVLGNYCTDGQGTKTQNGMRFVGAADRLIVTGNICYGNLATNVTGNASLTNSVYANNITA